MSIKPIRIKARKTSFDGRTGILKKKNIARKLFFADGSLKANISLHAPDDFMSLFHFDIEVQRGVISPFDEKIGAVVVSSDDGTHVILLKPIKIKGKKVDHIWFKRILLPPGRYKARVGFKDHYGEYGIWVGLDKTANEYLKRHVIIE